MLEIEPMYLNPGRIRNNVRIIRRDRSEIASEMKTGSWFYDLEPGYGVPEIGRLIDVISQLDESEAVFRLAAAGHAPDFVFKFSSGRNLLEVRDVETGEMLYKAPDGK